MLGTFLGSIGVGGRCILFYCSFHIYDQQFCFRNGRTTLAPEKTERLYSFCVCEGICFIQASVSHRGLDRIDTYNIFLNEKKKKKSTYVTYGK